MKSTFLWMDQRCTVEAPLEVSRDVIALFPTLASTPVPDDAVDIRVFAEPPGFRVEMGGGTARGSLPQVVSAVELAVTRRLMAGETRHAHIHGSAALAPGGGAVLAVGASGAGKSTLAYAWYRMGVPVFGDDVIAVDDQARIHAFPRPLKVDVARLREAGERPEDTVAFDPGEPDVWVDPTRGAGWAHHGAPVRVLAEIRYVEDASEEPRRVEGPDRLRVILNALHETGMPRRDVLDRLILLVEQARVYRLEFSHAPRLASLLLALSEDAGD